MRKVPLHCPLSLQRRTREVLRIHLLSMLRRGGDDHEAEIILVSSSIGVLSRGKGCYLCVNIGFVEGVNETSWVQAIEEFGAGT
jgi:hypothetical protein